MNPRIAKLSQYHGYPIPYFARIRMDGTPDFKVTDESKRQLCAIERRCWVCGELLLHVPVAFIGGPHSIKYRLFVDGPMHKECAMDALDICPFMLGKIDYATEFQLERHRDPINLCDRPNEIPPVQLGLVIARGFNVEQMQRSGYHVWFFSPTAPDLEPVQWFERAITHQPKG